MKFSYSLLFTACAVLAQTSSELVNNDLKLVQEAMDELTNSTSFKSFQDDRAAGQELLKADLDNIKDDPAVKAYWDAQKSLFQVAKENNVTQSNVQGLRDGSSNTTGSADFDAKFAELKQQREELLESNPLFAKFEADKANIDASMQDQIRMQSQDPLVIKLREAQQKLKETAKAENITLPAPGQPMNFASSSNATTTTDAASTSTTNSVANLLGDATSSVVITSTTKKASGIMSTQTQSTTTTMSVANLAGATSTVTINPDALVDPLETAAPAEETEAVDPNPSSFDVLSSASSSAISLLAIGAAFLVL